MQPIFSKNKASIDNTAFLNWRISKQADILNMLNIADGFMMAALELAQNCLLDNQWKKADILIFPILMNTNHGIELYLKAMIWTINKINKSDARIEGKHNIRQIFHTLKSKVKTYGGALSLEEFQAGTEELEAYINELFAKIEATDKDDKMDFSRYPFSTKYDSHFYVNAIGNVEIDLENFVIRFESIKESLDALSGYLYHHELNREEFERD
ncbi:hypothetical protein [Hymenobacter cellulosivorans]|uniref:HEPN domain-containing protein n=1 Tax=Hymenobacter cellulosivorans TaxID=2932249 RepID=A0ABY4F963_9BACT|nr:hypothetical protein [Hymenobacter cellulosivorans]UOQ53055.1 hypothetical protein MUN80_25375 [Hymenobacter cellulosivorans]